MVSNIVRKNHCTDDKKMRPQIKAGIEMKFPITALTILLRAVAKTHT